MAAATGLPSVGYKTWCACRQSVCILVCSTIREVTNPLITKKPTDYRPSVPGPTYLEHFFLITCTTYFTRLLTSFRRYIQRLVSMSIADGLASTNLLLWIGAAASHSNTRHRWLYVCCWRRIYASVNWVIIQSDNGLSPNVTKPLSESMLDHC